MGRKERACAPSPNKQTNNGSRGTYRVVVCVGGGGLGGVSLMCAPSLIAGSEAVEGANPTPHSTYIYITIPSTTPTTPPPHHPTSPIPPPTSHHPYPNLQTSQSIDSKKLKSSQSDDPGNSEKLKKMLIDSDRLRSTQINSKKLKSTQTARLN